MKIIAQVPANLSWHQCIGCLEEMARKMEKDDLERISIHDAKRLGALVGFVETVVEHREQLAVQEAKENGKPLVGQGISELSHILLKASYRRSGLSPDAKSKARSEAFLTLVNNIKEWGLK